jgi:SAM-dependent methyltransferase
VIGVDPEPDMLLRARQAASEQGVTNATWMIGTDTDLPILGELLGHRTVGAVTIGQALHWMNHHDLFRALVPLVRGGGGVAVLTNGSPLWLQDTPWSRALRGWLEQWLGSPLTQTCGTDVASQARYRDSLIAAGFDVSEATFDYSDELDISRIVGGVFSALSSHQLPAPDQRSCFTEQVQGALEQHTPYMEHIRVAMIIGRIG